MVKLSLEVFKTENIGDMLHKTESVEPVTKPYACKVKAPYMIRWTKIIKTKR